MHQLCQHAMMPSNCRAGHDGRRSVLVAAGLAAQAQGLAARPGRLAMLCPASAKASEPSQTLTGCRACGIRSAATWPLSGSSGRCKMPQSSLHGDLWAIGGGPAPRGALGLAATRVTPIRSDRLARTGFVGGREELPGSCPRNRRPTPAPGAARLICIKHNPPPGSPAQPPRSRRLQLQALQCIAHKPLLAQTTPFPRLAMPHA